MCTQYFETFDVQRSRKKWDGHLRGHALSMCFFPCKIMLGHVCVLTNDTT